MHENSAMTNDRITTETRYNRTWDYYRHMIEWRYKLLTRVLGTWAALIVVCGWLWTNNLPRTAFMPCVIGVAASLVAFLMERRTVAIIHDCEVEGREIEVQSGRLGLFGKLIEGRGKPIAYDIIMPAVYLGGTILWAIASMVLFFLGR